MTGKQQNPSCLPPIVLLWHEEWGNACQKKPDFACRVVKTKLYNTGARRCELLHSICGCNVSFSPVAAGATTRTLNLQTKLEIPSPFQFNSVGHHQWPDDKIQERQTTGIFGKGRGKGKKKKKEKNFGKKSIPAPNGFYNLNPPIPDISLMTYVPVSPDSETPSRYFKCDRSLQLQNTIKVKRLNWTTRLRYY